VKRDLSKRLNNVVLNRAYFTEASIIKRDP